MSATDRLTVVIPAPRPVAVAGRGFLVRPATLRDLAEIQGWLDARFPDPLDAIGEQLFGPEPAQGTERDRLLTEAELAWDEGPPLWDDARGAALLATAEGASVLLWVALRRDNPGFTPEAAADLSLAITAAEYLAVRRAFIGSDTGHEITRLMLGDAWRPAPGPKPTWAECVHSVAEAMGWTYSQVYDLTLSEFGRAARRGKPAEAPGATIRGDIKAEWAALKALQARFRGGPPEGA